MHKCVNGRYDFSAVSDTELIDATATVQGIAIVNRSLYWPSYTDFSVISIGHACLFSVHLYMLVLISVIAL